MTPASEAHGEARRTTPPSPAAILAECFHALSQPLTSLRCGLELALGQNSTADQYRTCLESAVEQTGRVAALVGGMRELLEAEDPGEEVQAVKVDKLIAGITGDFLPTVETRKARLRVSCDSEGSILAEPRRLEKALIYVMETALCLSRSGGELRVEAIEDGGVGVLTIGVTYPRFAEHRGRASDITNGLRLKLARDGELRLAIATRILEVMGGSCQTSDSAEGWQFQLRIQLLKRLSAAG